MPTGGGKTIILSYIARGLAAQGKRVLILVHRQELLLQTSDKLRTAEQPHGIIWGKQPMNRELVQVASIQTLMRRLNLYENFDLIIIDEGHHAVASTYRKVFDAYPRARLLGVTATPVRTDGKGLGEIYDCLVLGPTISELTDSGFLVPARVFKPPTKFSPEGIPKRGGEYERAPLAVAMDKPSITGDAILHYRNNCPGEKALAFCVSVEHAKHVAAQFSINGIPAEAIDGSLPNSLRQSTLERFKGNGDLLLLASCDLVNEGFDVPNASAASLLRPTCSLGLHRQQLGRILRPAPGKTHATINDHVGNCQGYHNHGLPDYEPHWDLFGSKSDSEGSDEEPVPRLRRCPDCFAIFRPKPSCPVCGYVFTGSPREIEEVDGTLELATDTFEARKKKQELATTLDELIDFARRQGYRYPEIWARGKWDERSKQ